MNCAAILALSAHLALPGEWNEVHPGVQCDAGNWIGGAYYNSESKLSVFAGYDFGWLEAGLVAGYSGGPVLPMVRITYDVTDNLSVYASPAVTVDGDVGLVVGPQWTF